MKAIIFMFGSVFLTGVFGLIVLVIVDLWVHLLGELGKWVRS